MPSPATTSSSSSTSAFLGLIRRDLLLAWRKPGEAVNPIVFFLIVVSLFPLSLGPEVNLLQRMAPGVIWVAALLAALLSLENIFQADFDDGTLEQLVLSPHPPVVLVLAKVVAHWLVTGVPLMLFSPLLGVLLHLAGNVMGVLLLTLLLGTPILSLIGAVGAALTVSQKRGGVLMSILVLPLYIPVLIIGASAADAAAGGLPIEAHLNLLAALLVLTVTLTPWAVAAAVKISME